MDDRSRIVARSWWQDTSLHGLILGNAVTLAGVLTQHWSAGPLLWVYWGQSVVIGLLNVIRIMRLEQFSTEGFNINDRQPPANRATQVQTARFFAFHYGAFHFIYAGFLASRHPIAPLEWPGIAVAVVSFACAHSYSMVVNHGRDFRSRCPNIGALMFYPYLRILPMHLTIILGSAMPLAALPLFVGLKTAADCGMHLVEHKLFRDANEVLPAEPATSESPPPAALDAPPARTGTDG
jgi:Family of unknown function (DUF6498)